MRKVIQLILFVLFTMPVILAAQSNFGSNEEEISKCKMHSSLYREFLKTEDYKYALDHWEIADKLCPLASKNHYPNGRLIILGLRENQDSKKIKKILTQKLMILYDNWLLVTDSPDETIKLRDSDLKKINE
jgi:hypothetical protein